MRDKRWRPYFEAATRDNSSSIAQVRSPLSLNIKSRRIFKKFSEHQTETQVWVNLIEAKEPTQNTFSNKQINKCTA